MTECSQASFEFAAHVSRSVVASFDGGTLTSDGGALLLRQTERHIRLLPRLAAREHLRLLLVGGEAEGRRLERLARTCPAGRVEVALSLPLVDLARRLQACGFFLGHDSGITHLAAALGLPGLVLWGESPIAVWRPRHPAMLCLEAGAHLQDLDVASVWAALLPRLAPR